MMRVIEFWNDMDKRRIKSVGCLILVGASIVALLAACTAADALIGIHSAFLPDNQIPTPTISFDEGTDQVFVGNTVGLTASGSGEGAEYAWQVSAGTVESDGESAAFTATATEGEITITVTATVPGSAGEAQAETIATIRDNHYALLANTSSVNINPVSATALEWSTDSLDASYFGRPSSTELEVLQPGDYFLALTIPMETTVERASVRAQVYVNGSPWPGGIAESAYVRNNTGDHSESSDHLAILLDGLSTGDVIEVYASQGAVVGTVTITGQATLYAEYVDQGRTVFSAVSATAFDTTDVYVDPLSAVSIPWEQQLADTGFSHSDVTNPEQITLDAAGYYLVTANVPLNTSSAGGNVRVNAELNVRLNGTPVVGGQAQQGYIRRTTSHENSTLHWSGVVNATTAGSVLSFTVSKEPSASIADQTVTPNGKKATVFVERIDTSEFVFSAHANQLVNGTNWNSNSESGVAWQTVEVQDTVTYSHSTVLLDSHQITINREGDYLLIYNDALKMFGGDIRLNPRIRIAINGTPVAGAETKSHYMRNDPGDGNFESSASLVFYLRQLSAGDVLTVTAEAEAETASQAIADDSATLTLIRKK
jgi:hypothetical protein